MQAPPRRQNGHVVHFANRAACPKCRSGNTGVRTTRTDEDGVIQRQRICRDCGHRFTTAQEPEYLIKAPHLP